MKFNKLSLWLLLALGLSGFNNLKSEPELGILSTINLQNLSREKLIVIGLIGISFYVFIKFFLKNNKFNYGDGFTRSGRTQAATHCHCGPGFSFIPVKDSSVGHAGCNSIPGYCEHGVEADLIGEYSRGHNYCHQCNRLIRFTNQERDRVRDSRAKELANRRSMHEKYSSKH